MSDIPILNPRREWACPNCSARDTTVEARPHTRYHTCPGLGGISAPMLSAQEVENRAVRVRAIEREDYAGRSTVETDENGKAIMAVETERPDGSTDLAVLAPCINLEVLQ